jgi:hypothetical protein
MEQNLPSSPVPVSIKSSQNHRRLLPTISIFFILGVIIAAGLIFYFRRTAGHKLEQTSKGETEEINPLPQTGLAGTIEQINGNQLTVSENTEKKATYKVVVTPQTTITILPVTIPYSVKIATPSANFKATIADLEAGQLISVTSKNDIRKLTSDHFEASSIIVSSQPTIIEATIDEVLGQQLIVTASPPSVPETKTLKILFNDKTEIVRSAIFDDSTKPVKKAQLSPSNLEAGKKIILYTDSDINSSSLNALKIDIIAPPK